MSILIIEDESVLEDKLHQLYEKDHSMHTWQRFIKGLDSNIIKVTINNWDTEIEFKDDMYKTWFILRFSS